MREKLGALLRGSRPGRGRTARQEGIAFIWLVVAVAVMAVLLAGAIQPATVMVQRDREEELIFRGEEYAEAIRAYQKDHGGQMPTELKALLKPGGPQKPRYLRRLYRNPFDIEEGKWGLLGPGTTVFKADSKGNLVPVDAKDLKPGEMPTLSPQPLSQGLLGATTLPGVQGGLQGQPGASPMGQVYPFKFGGQEGQPILGVYAPQKVKAFKQYQNRSNIDEWAFSPLVIQPKTIQKPGTAPVPGQTLPGQTLPGSTGLPGTQGGRY